MRVLVTGGAGLLGQMLLGTAPAGVELHATQRHTPVRGEGVRVHRLDLADAAATATLVETAAPDVVVHTAYGKAQGERDIVEATAAVATACARSVAALVHVSSDVVFDGEHAPYDEDAAPAPIEPYGRHKARAEQAVRATVPDATIVRTSLLIRPDPPDATTRWLADELRAGREPRLYADELRCPTAPDDLAAMLWELVGLPPDARTGVWHLTGPEAVSRYTLGLLLARRLGLDPAFTAGSNREHPTPRPRDLRLSTRRADTLLRTRARPIGAALTS
jgi:dTDP-4-dehydrorhamnose reductase